MAALTLRLTHTGLVATALFLADLQNANAGPVYVAVNGTIDLNYTTQVAKSYVDGTIRGFIAQGFLTDELLGGPVLENASRSFSGVLALPDATPTDVPLPTSDVDGGIPYSVPHLVVPTTGQYVVSVALTFAPSAAGTYRAFLFGPDWPVGADWRFFVEQIGTFKSYSDDWAGWYVPAFDPVNPALVLQSGVRHYASGARLKVVALQDTGGVLNLTDASVVLKRL